MGSPFSSNEILKNILFIEAVKKQRIFYSNFRKRKFLYLE